MCKNHNFCISAKTGVIQNNIDTKRRNKDSKADIGPKAGEDTFINKKRPTLLFWSLIPQHFDLTLFISS